MAEVEPGLYRHHKGGFYTVLTTATMEGTGVPVVVYQGQDGRVWVRSEQEFLHLSDHLARFKRMPPHSDCPMCRGTGMITDPAYTFAGRDCGCRNVLPSPPDGMEFVPGTQQDYVRTIGLKTPNGRHRE